MKGKLRATLNAHHNRFDSFDFESAGHDEFIAVAGLRQMLAGNSPENRHKSPTLNKNKLPGKQKGKGVPIRSATITENDIPAVPVTPNGFTNAAQRWLEMSTVFAQMQPLVDFARDKGVLRGQDALQRFIEAQQNGQIPMQQPSIPNFPAGAQAAVAAAQGNPQVQFAAGIGPNGIPQAPNFTGLRPQPGMNSQFTSPATGHLGLPNAMNSPHMRQGGSPGQPGLPPHLQGAAMAPQMVAQHSMQGTHSSAGSSNASPNAPGKKRRASQVKLDGSGDPGGAPQLNGVAPNPKVTPKMGQQPKRPRAN